MHALHERPLLPSKRWNKNPPKKSPGNGGKSIHKLVSGIGGGQIFIIHLPFII
jgi:hypothetical protein